MVDIYPPYIFGMHDRGGEHLMLGKNRPGWVLVTEAVGADPNNHSGSNYTDLTHQGLGVIVRLNNGYGTAGTIPHSSEYDNFARRCGNFVQASPGCHIWIIGNEPNLANERPGGPDGQKITPELYAECFAKCRSQIHARAGHETDQVVVAAVGPWNVETKYPGNQSGDWVRYMADILDLLGQKVDGIALHTYTHGQEPHLVFSDVKMNAPFDDRHWHFRAYRDFMSAIRTDLRNRPVYLTETDQYDAWRDANTGWVRNAYKEIDDWNRVSSNQPIQSLILYRWIIGNPNNPQEVGWAIQPKPGVQNDFRDAMNNPYRLVLPHTRPEYLVYWEEVNAPGRMEPESLVRFSVTARNDGRLIWPNTGTQAVRLGSHWIDVDGDSVEGLRSDLPQTVDAGDEVTLPAATVRAPAKPGYYTLELDMVEGPSNWFAEHDSPVWRSVGVQIGPRYRAAWVSAHPPAEGDAGQTVTFPVTVRNDGALIWPPSGDNPVRLTYKWLDADGNVVVQDGLRTPLGREVPPLDEITLDARVQFPAQAGQYTLQLDMVQEFVVWFHWKGSPVYESPVEVVSTLPAYAAEWLEYSGPQRLVAGQTGDAYLEVKNVGSQPWPHSGDGAVRLGYRWFNDQDEEVTADDVETWPMPETILHGNVATFREISFVAPDVPGAYRLVWDLKRDGTWLSTLGVAVLEQAMQILGSEYGVAWTALEPWPEWMSPGEVQTTSLRLENIGTRTWTARGAHPVHLAYTWFSQGGTLSEPWDTFRIMLPLDVVPGSVVDLDDIPFKTPAVLGNYILRWDLVEEGVTWFFRQGGVPLEVPVEVSDRVLPVPWSAQASHNPQDVDLSFDGNPDTAWNSKASQEPGMWYQVDLGQDLVLDRVKIASPGRGFPAGYKISLSADGQDWHLVVEQAKNWMNVDVSFSPCRARYVHVEQTGQTSWGATWMISEIAVSATDVWEGTEASHYTEYADRAIDAHLPTYWNTRSVVQKPGMWYKLDMGALQRIERVRLTNPPGQLPRGYVMEISTDEQNWKEVGRSDDNWGEVDVQFTPRTARYLRVQTTGSSPYHPWGISEVKVWRASPTWMVGRKD